MIVTITGVSGSGKSTLASLVAEKLRLNLIDVDLIVKNMYLNSEMQNKLKETFGTEVLNKDNQVDKSLVSKIVLVSQEKWDLLNAITWAYIENAIDKALLESKNNAVIDYTFIPKTKYFHISDINILVSPIDMERRANNVLLRDKISLEKLEKRDSFSPKFSDYTFDYIIENDYTDNFEIKCYKVIEDIRGK